jgi:hypothetical protein
LKPRIRQSLLFIVLVSSVLSVSAVKLWSRLMSPPSTADVRELAEKAPIVFRGRVAKVRSAEHRPHAYGVDSFATFDVDRLYRGSVGKDPSIQYGVDSFATFDVDRLYRGSVRKDPTIHFVYSGSDTGMDGHNCIDFQPDTYWLVFAVEKSGQLELFDDCEGALAISPLLGPQLKDFAWLVQMEADFLAGLNDAAAANRIVSIQRLGGLKSPSCQDALHRVIDKADQNEANWAVYAALRTGDISVLPRVKHILSVGEMSSPERQIAFELKNVSDPNAVPDLIAILARAPGELTRLSVLTALAEKIRDPRALPILADHLSGDAESSQYLALEGLENITREKACSVPNGSNTQNFASRIRQCKLWWEEKGKFQSWDKD